MSNLNTLKADSFYEVFFDNDFDASRHANNIIQGTSIAICLQKLSDGISCIEKELHAQVVSHHHDLIAQATSMEQLESVLGIITSRVEVHFHLRFSSIFYIWF